MSDGAVLITGASQGIGRAFAGIAAAEGRDLVLSARSGDILESLAQELRKAHGVDVRIIVADLSDREDVDRLWREAVAGGRIETLVNNAGLGYNGPFGSDSGWPRERQSLEVNVFALTRLMVLAAEHMKGRGGRILNVASVAAFLPGPRMAVYHASKSYVLSLSEAVASELAGTGVTVTVLCPGATESRFFDEADMRGAPIARFTRLPGAEAVARVGWKAAMKGRRVAVPGAMNRLTTLSTRAVPRRILTAIAGRLMAAPRD